MDMDMDQSLFERVLRNKLHVVQPLLLGKTSNTYNLRRRQHERQWRRQKWARGSPLMGRLAPSMKHTGHKLGGKLSEIFEC